MAFAVALARPDEALALVEGVEPGPYRVLGHVRLGTLYAPTDKARSAKAFDAAFEQLELGPEAFRSWGGYGGGSAVAAVAVVRAKEAGYPDVPHLVARCLALTSGGRDRGSPEERENTVVNVAAALALADPAAARHLLATVAPPDELIKRAATRSRDWLFAVALAHPERAAGLIDALAARAKAGREAGNGLSTTGVIELGSTLTAADRLKDLTGWAGLPREVGDDD